MIESVIKICLQAGSKVLQIYYEDRALDVSKKEDNTPVTSADLFSNDIIIANLESLTPGVPILSEENISSWSSNKIIDCFWVVDPLDGTKEFLSRNCEFTVNIALVEYGVPIIGVVYVPAMGVLYAAENGQAWKMNVHTQYRLKIFARNVYPPVVVVSRFHNNLIQLHTYLMNFIDYKIITVGSSLKFCLVAEGLAQIYPRFSFMNIWDVAPGHAIALAAGAFISDWNGYALRYNNIFFPTLSHFGFLCSVCILKFSSFNLKNYS